MANQSVVLLSNLRKDLLEALPGLVTLNPDPALAHTAQEAAALSLVKDLVRKERPSSTDTETLRRLESEAIEKFLWANDKCRRYGPQLKLTEYVMDEVRVILNRLPEVTFPRCFSRARTGPGSSIGSRSRNSELEKLFLNEITSYSPDTVYQYLRLVRLFPMYRAAELQRMVMLGANKAFRIVGSSKFSTVRKTISTDRGICTEASLDMFFQLGTGELINEFLMDEFGYDPELQPDRNRALVLQASVDGETASVDLTSASDLNSRGLVKDSLHFRPEWYEHLTQLSAPTTVLPDGRVVETWMISSMGNGFTFPLETLLFSCIIKGLGRVLGVKLTRFDSPSANFGVFGDDLIVPVELVEPLLAVLADLGHVPNPQKTFTRGPFRESCGVDAFEGHNVRAVFHKSWSRAGRYATINGLNLWSARWGIPLRRTIRQLLPKGWKDHLVPLYEDPSSGIYSPVDQPATHYRAWASSPVTTYIWRKERHGRERVYSLKQRFGNPFGVLLCYIHGSIRNGVLSRRTPPGEDNEDAYRSECLRRATHWVCRGELRFFGISFEMWTTLAGLNLSI